VRIIEGERRRWRRENTEHKSSILFLGTSQKGDIKIGGVEDGIGRYACSESALFLI